MAGIPRDVVVARKPGALVTISHCQLAHRNNVGGRQHPSSDKAFAAGKILHKGWVEPKSRAYVISEAEHLQDFDSIPTLPTTHRRPLLVKIPFHSPFMCTLKMKLKRGRLKKRLANLRLVRVLSPTEQGFLSARSDLI
jgi:hypothetical protein